MTAENGNFKERFNPGPLSVTQNNIGRGGYVQEIGTAGAEIINFGDITTEGYMFLRNTDATNYVEYGPDQIDRIL